MGALVRYILAVVQSITQFLHGLPIIGWWLNVASALCATAVRFGAGNTTRCPRDHDGLKPIVLYEYEGCPFCAKVREAATVLDLDCLHYPTPRETLKRYGVVKESRFRNDVRDKHGGDKIMFPFMVDENPSPPVKMYESDAIVAYLWRTYGGGEGARAPLCYWLGARLLPGPLKMLSLALSRFCRPLPEHGMLRTPSRADLVDAPGFQPLELWNMEASPFCRIAREALCTLELPYVAHNMAHGSAAKRAAFAQRFGDKLPAWRRKLGLAMLPWLVDPNTGFCGGESADIVAYLRRTYGAGEVVRESFLDYTTAGASKAHGTMPGAASSSTNKAD